MNLGCILGHNWFEDHPWQAVPDLPRPLASLWSHPGQIDGEETNFVQSTCQSDISYINGRFHNSFDMDYL